jgi:hypothetical protein
MNIIVHTDDPADLIYAYRAIKDSIANSHDQCAYAFGQPEKMSAFTKRRKSGWTVWMQKPAQ